MTYDQRKRMDYALMEQIKRCEDLEAMMSLISNRIENAIIMEMTKDMAKKMDEFIMGSDQSKPVGKISGDLNI